MKTSLLVLIALAGCGSSSDSSNSTSQPSSAPTQPPASKTAVVIDTDMAVDDWLAILYLLQRPDVSVKAITVTGAGEAHCGPGVRYALGLVALSGHSDVPVACGRETPLEGDHAFPSDWRDRVDNLAGLTLPESEDAASDLTAPELLASVIQSSAEGVTLLTLGPLTNVAEALQDVPSLIDNIENIYVMGGAVHVPGNVGTSGVSIENDVAEWNIYVDPVAADVVFRSGASITLVALDATNHVPLTLEFLDGLEGNHSSPEATFVFDALSEQREFIAFGYYFWDPLAAAVLTDEDLATFETTGVCIVIDEGPESGRTKPDDGCSAVRVAVAADAGRFEQLFLEALKS